ncbi:MAG: hypothetical protein CBB92_10270 [Flammeovirgaceae bacterium TMED32]|nr:MAG: hypothetical protein CBB92_10270 [Flammeovirgaceae bacterium TMED32]
MKIIRSAGSEKIQLILNDSVTHEIKSGLTATLATFSFPLNKKNNQIIGLANRFRLERNRSII